MSFMLLQTNRLPNTLIICVHPLKGYATKMLTLQKVQKDIATPIEKSNKSFHLFFIFCTLFTSKGAHL